MQFYWNKLLKIIYYIYTKFFFWKFRGGHCPPRSKNSSVPGLHGSWAIHVRSNQDKYIIDLILVPTKATFVCVNHLYMLHKHWMTQCHISAHHSSARGDCLWEWADLSLPTYLSYHKTHHMVYVCVNIHIIKWITSYVFKTKYLKRVQ